MYLQQSLPLLVSTYSQKYIVFSFFSQNLLPVLSSACPKSKKKHCEAAVINKDKDANSTQGIHDPQTSKSAEQNVTESDPNPMDKLKKDSAAPENKSSPPAIDINTESYEEKRLRNIAERKKKFNELQLTEKRLLASGKKSGVAPTPESEPTYEGEPVPKTNRKIARNPFYKPISSSKKEKNINSTQGILDPQTSKATNPYFKGRLPNLETKLKGVISEKKRDALKIRHYVQKTISKLYICPVCNKPDYEGGILWIQCDVCNKWYHYECVGLGKNFHQSEKPKDWFCDDCSV